jgi:arylsulfatase A
MRSLIVIAVCIVASWLSAALAEPAPRRPNLILILADDLGYETIGANGGTSYATPAIDRLAAGGVRFEHCYVQPLCTPTRVQLLTGLSNVRNYVGFGVMDPAATTFAEPLREAGYATCVAGKWQLGHDLDLPQRFGFDAHCLWQHTRRPPRYANPGLEVDGRRIDYAQGEYGPDIVQDYALDFIERNKGRPFLLYYPLLLVHDPYQPTPDSPDWDPRATGEQVNRKPRHFADMVAYMDKLVGRLVERLEELGLREDTLIVFVGDNGTGRGMVSHMGERRVAGGKGSTTVAGMHVPLIVSWPRGARAGIVCTDLVESTDFFPTLLEAAGVPLPDGHRAGWPQLPAAGARRARESARLLLLLVFAARGASPGVCRRHPLQALPLGGVSRRRGRPRGKPAARRAGVRCGRPGGPGAARRSARTV